MDDSLQFYIFAALMVAVITFFIFVLFPLLFAQFRKRPIDKKEYTMFCFIANSPTVLLFLYGAANGLAHPFYLACQIVYYFLWTYVFSRAGIKILRDRGVLEYLEESHDSSVERDNNSVSTDNVKAEESKNDFGNKAKDISEITVADSSLEDNGSELEEHDTARETQEIRQDDEDNIETTPKIRFCRHCGVEIAPDAEFCHRCGTKVVHVEQPE